MQSDLLQRFVGSMTIDFDMWHDGMGYDLDALRAMNKGEQQAAEALLLEHLRVKPDWRDVEALAALESLSARRAVLDAREHPSAEVRNCALRCSTSIESKSETQIETADRLVEAGIIRSIHSAACMNNLASTLDLAEEHPTPGVKQALLDRVLTGDATTRVNCAALLLYLCGGAAEPFDWAHRPFFLRFHTDDTEELQAAWRELRERVGLGIEGRFDR